MREDIQVNVILTVYFWNRDRPFRVVLAVPNGPVSDLMIPNVHDRPL